MRQFRKNWTGDSARQEELALVSGLAELLVQGDKQIATQQKEAREREEKEWKRKHKRR